MPVPALVLGRSWPCGIYCVDAADAVAAFKLLMFELLLPWYMILLLPVGRGFVGKLRRVTDDALGKAQATDEALGRTLFFR